MAEGKTEGGVCGWLRKWSLFFASPDKHPDTDLPQHVRENIGGLAARWNLHEVFAVKEYMYQVVTYANETRTISFDYDTRDQYINATFGSRSLLEPDGRHAWPNIDFQDGVEVCANRLGIPNVWDGPTAHSDEDFRRRIQALITQIGNMEEIIFGSPDERLVGP